MKITRTALILLVLAAAVCAQEVEVTITDILVFKNDETVAKEYLFSRINKVKTDSKNNIYIQEYKQGNTGNIAMITKYSPEGKYLTAIGKLGEGPGEFQRITDFIFLENDNLYLIDDLSQRTTIYNNETKKFEVIGQINPPVFLPMIYFYSPDKLLVINNNEQRANENLLYIKSLDWKTTFYDFGHPSVFINSTDPNFDDKINYHSNPLNICLAGENKIIAAPYFYDGELTILTNENGAWKAKRVKGFQPKYDSFEKISRKEFEKISSKKEIHTGGGGSSRFQYDYLQHSCSSSLFTYKNKYILHFFSVCRHSSYVDRRIDVFDIDGKYLGGKVLSTRTAGNTQITSLSVLWKDKDENFYIVEYANRVPILKKVKLDISF